MYTGKNRFTYFIFKAIIRISTVSCDFQIEILQNCQTQNNYKIDGAETEKSTEEENITKNENPVECHSAASNFSPQKNSSISFINVRVTLNLARNTIVIFNNKNKKYVEIN